MVRRFNKQPSETYTIAVDFVGALPVGETPFSGTVSARKYETGVTDNTVLSSTTATISGTQARIRVLGGTSGLVYRITFLVTLTNNDLLEEDVDMFVLSE